MALKDAMKSAVELVVPPSPAELRSRLDQARQALVQAQDSHTAKQAAYDVALASDTPREGQEAQAAVIQAKLALERAAGRLQALEKQLAKAEAEQAADELEAGRKRLAGLIADRQHRGEQILAALDALQAAVEAFGANEAAILALPESVRGRNAVPGFNLGVGPLQAHLSVELAQRGIVGQPTSVQTVRLADWLSLGSRTLGS